MSDLHRFVIQVAAGKVQRSRRHFFIPPKGLAWEEWVECTLCSETVYRNVAFRHAGNPLGCPDVRSLLTDNTVRTTGGTRGSAPRISKPTIVSPSDEQCAIGGPYPFQPPGWAPTLHPTAVLVGAADAFGNPASQPHLSPPSSGSTQETQCSSVPGGAEGAGPCSTPPQGDPVLAPPDPSSPTSNHSSPCGPSPSIPSASGEEEEAPRVTPTPPPCPSL